MRIVPLLALAMLCAGCAADEGAGGYGVAQAETGAEFRRDVNALLYILDPPCPITEVPELVALYEPANVRFAALENSLEGTVSGIDIVVARADYPLTQPLVECANPDGPDARQNVERAVSEAMDLIAKLEASSDQSPVK